MRRFSLVRTIGTFGLIVLGAILFALSHPNFLISSGIFPLAFVAIVPLGLAVRRMTWWATPLWGIAYGFISYALFNYWLATFHPLAIFIVPTIYAGYFFVVVPALWLADRRFGAWAFLAQAVIWMAYEWIRTQWYLGYAYGIMGYALWPAPVLFQIVEFGGVWIVSFIVVLPSFFIAQMINQAGVRGAGAAALRRPAVVGVYGAVLAATILYGVVSPVDYSAARNWRVALIQQNIDPWVGGFRTYERSLEILLRESTRAIRESDPDVVVWSETSFVPSINYHTQYRTDQERYELVRELRQYLDAQDRPFVIGNSDGRLRRNESGELERIDYNAVVVFNAGGEIQDTYRKIHLVPFTEHFPYERQFPWLHRALVENDTNFWYAGEEWTVFESDGVRYSTPICFEDTFGYLSRGFVRHGAEVIVNLTNDLWSKSEACAMQHMSMAVFRSVENRRSVVRSTNGGMTVIIDPNGRITHRLEPFVEGHLVGDVPVYTDRDTVYTAWGDWLACLFVACGAMIVVAGFILTVLHRRQRDDQID